MVTALTSIYIGYIIKSSKYIISMAAVDALVYIFCEGQILQGYGVNFPNPAIVSSNVPGKFMFCFMPKKVDSNTEIDVNLDIVVESEKYMQYKKILSNNNIL